MVTCDECIRAIGETSWAISRTVKLERKLKRHKEKIKIIDQLQARHRSENFFARQRQMIANSLLDKLQITPKMAEIITGKVRPMNHT